MNKLTRPFHRTKALLRRISLGQLVVSNLFLMGMLSTINAIVDQPMHKALDSLGLDPVIHETLIGKSTTWRSIYWVALSFERGRDQSCASFAQLHGLSIKALSQTYQQALQWADQTLQVINVG